MFIEHEPKVNMTHNTRTEFLTSNHFDCSWIWYHINKLFFRIKFFSHTTECHVAKQ